MSDSRATSGQAGYFVQDTDETGIDLKSNRQLVVGFGAIVLAIVVAGIVSIWSVIHVAELNEQLYRHPLAVSNAVLDVNGNLIAIHRSMERVVLADDSAAIDLIVVQIDEHEQRIYDDFAIVEERFLGDKEQIQEVLNLIRDWKPIRDEVIGLMRDGKQSRAAAVTKGKGAAHIALINQKMAGLIEFTSGTAAEFRASAEETSARAIVTTSTSVVAAIFLTLVISFVTLRSLQREGRKHTLAEAELQRLSSFPERNPHPVMELRRDGGANCCNPFAGSLLERLGLTVGEIEGILPEGYREQLQKCLREQREVGCPECELDGRTISWTFCPVPGTDLVHAYGRDVTERKRNEESLRLQGAALESAANAIIITDRDGRVTWTNHAFSQLTGYSREEAVGSHTRMLKSGQHDAEFYANLWRTVLAGKVWQGEIVNRRKDGSLYTEEQTITPVTDECGEITHFVAVKQDITERKKAEAKQKQLQCELAHAQKLESVGQLAAGIAHEINTPTQYVGDNTRFLKDAFGEMSTVLDSCEKLLQAAKDGTVDEQLVAEVEAVRKQADVEYLREEIPQAIDQSLDGVERVATIVRAMKEFSHPGDGEKSLANLKEALETTITVSRNEWKYAAEVVTKFDPELPDVLCLIGELSQVFLNLIVNAAHAITDALGENATEKGTITVGTRRDGDHWVEIFVRDTGTGIPPDIRARIFDPFFTTKEVGKGTGQGLAIARSVVVDKHGGTIDCETEPGKGTTFTVRLPIDGQQPTQGARNGCEDACSIR